ncbi:MAG: 2TM domain-containing protein [Chloroflexi bacterium]|nr:2TM domain-containing protein [Chloroflexota bacterium]
MAGRDDDFEGIDISGPWGGVRIGGGGERANSDDPDEDLDLRAIRRTVHQRFEFYRHLSIYLLVVGSLTLLDWATDGDWWVQWVAGIWGAFLFVQFFTTFISGTLWGRDAEERTVRRAVERHRRRARVASSEPAPPAANED